MWQTSVIFGSGPVVEKPVGKLPNLRIPIRSMGKIPMIDAKGLDLFFFVNFYGLYHGIHHH